MGAGESATNGIFSDDFKRLIENLLELVSIGGEIKAVLDEIKTEMQESNSLLREIRDGGQD